MADRAREILRDVFAQRSSVGNRIHPAEEQNLNRCPLQRKPMPAHRRHRHASTVRTSAPVLLVVMKRCFIAHPYG